MSFADIDLALFDAMLDDDVEAMDRILTAWDPIDLEVLLRNLPSLKVAAQAAYNRHKQAADLEERLRQIEAVAPADMGIAHPDTQPLP